MIHECGREAALEELEAPLSRAATQIKTLRRKIARHVWLEALVFGALSWIAAVIVAAPITWALEAACGSIFFKLPLGFYVSPSALATWLGLVLVVASIASFYPARRAARLTVREALRHS